MLRSVIGYWCARRFMVALAGLALVCGPAPAFAADTGSSGGDRQRFVSVTRNLEAFPFSPNAKADRAWAIEWLVDVPDVSVSACSGPLGGLIDSDYPYAAEITVQYMFEMAVL